MRSHLKHPRQLIVDICKQVLHVRPRDLKWAHGEGGRGDQLACEGRGTGRAVLDIVLGQPGRLREAPRPEISAWGGRAGSILPRVKRGGKGLR